VGKCSSRASNRCSVSTGQAFFSGQSIQPAPAESSSDDSDAQDTRDDATVADDDPDQDADSASDDSFDDSDSV
jgi:hypothetical protein